MAEREARPTAPGPYEYVWTKGLYRKPIVVHRVMVSRLVQTACGMPMYSSDRRYELGDTVPYRALNPALVRLCGHCWRPGGPR